MSELQVSFMQSGVWHPLLIFFIGRERMKMTQMMMTKTKMKMTMRVMKTMASENKILWWVALSWMWLYGVCK